MRRRLRPPDAAAFAYFAHDARESAVQKRIAALEANGRRVVGFTFVRRHQAERKDIPFDNVPLGVTVDRNYVRRLLPLAVGLFAALGHARTLRHAEVIQARNLDMMALAFFARLLARAKAPLVYEVLDVQPVMLAKGPLGFGARLLERRLLRAADLLVVSSPDFITRYFAPVQGYSAPWHLLENKISGSQLRSALKAPAVHEPALPPWVIGWFGVLRCARSLQILAAIAERMGTKVRIYIRGRVSHEDIDETAFTRVVNRHPNMVYDGPYISPEELADIYAKVHFSWSIDYTDAGTNSDWLLPVRLYEGGYHNVVALTRQNTATARVALERGLGYAFREPLEQTVPAFIEQLGQPGYRCLRQKIAEMPRTLFVDQTDTSEYLMRLDSIRTNRTRKKHPPPMRRHA
jgi:hypothetical protein